MWTKLRYDGLGRVRAWQPTIPRLAVFILAAWLSILAARPASPLVVPAVEQPPAPVSCNIDPPFVVIRGRYVNFPFGYSIDLPDDNFALTTPPPSPQHGCSIDLDDNDRLMTYTDVWRKRETERQIWVDGSYNAAFFATLDDEIEQELAWMVERARNARILAREQTQLDGLRAVRVMISYNDSVTGRQVLEWWVVAGREDPDGNSVNERGQRIDDIRYTVRLKTTPVHLVEDEKTFEQMLRSWKTRAIW